MGIASLHPSYAVPHTIVSQVEICAICSLWESGERRMADPVRDQLNEMYERMFNSGQIQRTDIIKGLAEYDAMAAGKLNAKYMLWSVIVAAFSALASAVSAALAAYTVWPKK
jgi:ABC-type glycerol-3-phosphate transport system permease component